jgi:putative ABC transport system substrate-binding protein
MRRREFIALLAGAGAAWPLAARAQQGAMPLIGYLFSGTDPGGTDPSRSGVAAFRKGLGETGFIEGRNVAIEYRFGENQPERLPGLAAELIRRRVRLIAAMGAAAGAAKVATSTIPIVFGTNSDPVEQGLVASLNRPGGNLTGVSFLGGELAPKRLGLLQEFVPHAKRFAMLADPASLGVESNIASVQAAAADLGLALEIFRAGSNREIDMAVADLANKRIEGVLVGGSVLFNARRLQLAILAARYLMPAIYYDRVFPESGGLMSYGSNILDQYRQVGVYAGRILKGEKPADLPVMQPTKFELIINLQTARTIDLPVPPSLLATADEVIE